MWTRLVRSSPPMVAKTSMEKRDLGMATTTTVVAMMTMTVVETHLARPAPFPYLPMP